MASACQMAGLDAEGVEQLRFGVNALYRPATTPVVVRVARGPAYLPSARREVAVSRWLADEGFPARTVDVIEQPLMTPCADSGSGLGFGGQLQIGFCADLHGDEQESRGPLGPRLDGLAHPAVLPGVSSCQCHVS